MTTTMAPFDPLRCQRAVGDDEDLLATQGQIASYGEPTDDELDIINTKHARTPLTKSDIYVMDMVPSSTAVDSYFTRMDHKTTLPRFVRGSNAGVSIMNCHARRELPIGRSFRGHLIDDHFETPRGHKLYASPEAPLVYTAAYLPRALHTSSAPNDDIIRAIEAGVANDVSVGFGGNDYWYRCDECGNDMWRSRDCTHWPGMTITNTETGERRRVTATVVDADLSEISPVWKGSNPTAEMLRKLEDLVTREILSYADVAELDRATGRRMVARLDWASLKTRSYPVPDNNQKTRDPAATTADQAAQQDAAREALDEALRAEAGADDAQATKDGQQEGAPEGAEAARGASDAAADGKSQPAQEHPLVALLRAENVTDEMALRQLIQQAADGRAYRSHLIELCHKAGVRALGADYRREANERLLSGASVADLQDILAERNAAARARFGKDTTDPADAETERMRAALAEQTGLKASAGGRQTQAAPAANVTPLRGAPTTGAAADERTFSAFRMPKA